MPQTYPTPQRAELKVTHRQPFTLRDADDLFHQFGVLRSDYSPKITAAMPSTAPLDVAQSLMWAPVLVPATGDEDRVRNSRRNGGGLPVRGRDCLQRA